MDHKAIAAMKDAILGAREFCGNEREAANEACCEKISRRPNSEEYFAAMLQADEVWNEYRREAGVTFNRTRNRAFKS